MEKRRFLATLIQWTNSKVRDLEDWGLKIKVVAITEQKDYN